jgi:hypothetical protein
MKLKWTIAAGCLFLAALVAGFFLTAAAWYWFSVPAYEPAGTASEDPADGSSGGTAPVIADDGPLGHLQRSILDDPELVREIEQLAEVPEIRALLEDEEIQQAISDGKYLKLMANKKFRRAAKHPAMRDLVRTIAKRSAANLLGKGSSRDEERPAP